VIYTINREGEKAIRRWCKKVGRFELLPEGFFLDAEEAARIAFDDPKPARVGMLEMKKHYTEAKKQPEFLELKREWFDATPESP
jgi:hypothetical protein